MSLECLESQIRKRGQLGNQQRTSSLKTLLSFMGFFSPGLTSMTVRAFRMFAAKTCGTDLFFKST
ncbi:hypothetical protein ASD26_02895 [Streptomyces sp. Root1319]|nr:hypothetical protein ASD26_02895 [Streptomyces sp. Root1319]